MHNYSNPLFRIPTDVWRYIILNNLSFVDLVNVSRVCKAFNKAAHVAIRIAIEKDLKKRNIVLEGREEAFKAYLFAAYCNSSRVRELCNQTQICALFGLGQAEWRLIEPDCSKIPYEKKNSGYQPKYVVFNVLRYRKTWADFRKHVEWRNKRREGAREYKKEQDRRRKEEDIAAAKRRKEEVELAATAAAKGRQKEEQKEMLRKRNREAIEEFAAAKRRQEKVQNTTQVEDQRRIAETAFFCRPNLTFEQVFEYQIKSQKF
jgi:flagellar biosynthesis GTPase FlhF